MHIEELRQHCLSFPGVTEHEIWQGDLTFKVGNKMFAHSVLEVAQVWLSFKATDERFAELVERQNVIPAPYLARAKWVALETREAIPATELRELLREAYDLVVAKLPKKIQASLAAKSQAKTKKPVKSKKQNSKRGKRRS
ncbi:MAG: MmcQ/YjbR family DNA-binding protein [Acidobacteria bacterium]|nr:MmcQ/YjbR family DNA-binding protein [Acidobacteriota bacterium]